MVANQQYHMIQGSTIIKLMEKISYVWNQSIYIYQTLGIDSGLEQMLQISENKDSEYDNSFSIKS